MLRKTIRTSIVSRQRLRGSLVARQSSGLAGPRFRCGCLVRPCVWARGMCSRMCAVHVQMFCTVVCIWKRLRDRPAWLTQQTEPTAGLHTLHTSAACCYDTVAPTAPWIPGDPSGCKLKSVWRGPRHAARTHTGTHAHTLMCSYAIGCRLSSDRLLYVVDAHRLESNKTWYKI